MHRFVIDQINPKNVVRPDEVHIEGGDVMLWNEHIYRYLQRSDYKDYITARTNLEGVQFIKDLFLTKLLRNLI
jgi:hypothetical protein